MKIAIISDIHDQIDHLTWALAHINEYQTIEHIFVLGDYCSPFIVEKLCTLKTPIHAIWGNNDGDKQTILRIASTHPSCTFAPREFATVEIDEKKYFLSHYEELAEHAAKSCDFDAVFHGHTHVIRNEKIGITPIINPGKLALYPNCIYSFAIFDTADDTTEIIIK